ncbi:hypothetical protein SFB93_00440 [Kurthia gibsonii]|uniref:hypothetical protein n=1 Tax=Kurthia gibsonii TaxID=33946 RepID=UPI0039834E48
MKNKQLVFYILGTILFIYALVLNLPLILDFEFPNAIMAFCLAYLTPHFAEKDERAQKIRERAIYMSYFWGMGFLLVLLIVFNPLSTFELAAFQLLSLFIALYLSIVFLNMVYYARKY